ncbi:MAG: hypothetical protein ACTSSP_10145 [Candidatus Asgardarchaeia archaeon]
MGEEGNVGWEMADYFNNKWQEELVQIIKMSETDKNMFGEIEKLAAYVDGYYKNIGDGATSYGHDDQKETKALTKKLKKIIASKKKRKTKTTNKTKADLIAELKLVSEKKKGLQHALTKSKKQIKDLRAKIKKNKITRADMMIRISELEEKNKELSEYYDRFDIIDL